MSKICHHNEKPSANGLFTKGQNLVADGQTSKMPSTTSGAGQIETNFGKQQRGCFNLEMTGDMQQSLYVINFVVQLITFSFCNNMNPGAGDQFFPQEYPPGWIYPLPGPYMFNDRGNPSPSPLTTSTDSLPESLQFSKDSLMPASTLIKIITVTTLCFINLPFEVFQGLPGCVFFTPLVFLAFFSPLQWIAP